MVFNGLRIGFRAVCSELVNHRAAAAPPEAVSLRLFFVFCPLFCFAGGGNGCFLVGCGSLVRCFRLIFTVFKRSASGCFVFCPFFCSAGGGNGWFLVGCGSSVCSFRLIFSVFQWSAFGCFWFFCPFFVPPVAATIDF